VRAGRVLGDQIVIDEGLQPGNRVIVEGFQKLTPGTPVHAVPW
jgi:membrane fusion protein, multidrug efflux system